MEKNKLIVYIGIAVFVLLLLGSILATSGFFNKSQSSASTGQTSFKSNTPKECQPPEGQDTASWKEHLGHHDNTKYCLDYYT